MINCVQQEQSFGSDSDAGGGGDSVCVLHNPGMLFLLCFHTECSSCQNVKLPK
jgi:hypothetical protein